MRKKMKMSEAQETALKKLQNSDPNSTKTSSIKYSISKPLSKKDNRKLKKKNKKRFENAEREEHKKSKGHCVFSARKTVSGGTFSKK